MADEYDFFALKALRDRLAAFQGRHAPTLHEYESEDGKGYCHQIFEKKEASVASTATCVSSLVAAGKWKGSLLEKTAAVAAYLLSKRKSAGLDEDNPFSLGFMAEGVLDLGEADPDYASREANEQQLRDHHAGKLIEHIRSEPDDSRPTRLRVPGSVSIPPYPPSSYLTQLSWRVLKRLESTNEDLRGSVHDWARSEISKQVALIGAKSRTADPLQLAYALILAVQTASDRQTSPEDKEIFGHALDLFFAQQHQDGAWPLSRPMFHYTEVGNAYCFDYELLTQLLLCKELQEDLLRHLSKLERAVLLAERTSYDLAPDKPGQRLAWASGHHPQLEGPESWSTASVYHFTYALDRLVAEGIRRELFKALGLVYPGPPSGPSEMPPGEGIGSFASKNFLDADLVLPSGKTESLKEILAKRFVFPIAREADLVEHGGQLSKRTPMSAILFGPPGTSKTQLAKIISGYLGWPLVSIDPSFIVQEGLDKVQAMANRLFSMLESVEQVVVLLDEFDEMGRDRSDNEDLLSRFITTAMLPKLAAINDARKIVFLLATNYVRGFDAAFSRGGRFDMRVQVMQPNLGQKLANKPWHAVFSEKLGLLGAADKAKVEKNIARLTYLETEELVQELMLASDAKAVVAAAALADKNGTLSKANSDKYDEEADAPRSSDKPSGDDGKTSGSSKAQTGRRKKPPTWADTCSRDRQEIRIPALPAS